MTKRYPRGDGGKRARSPGRARHKPLKPLRAGMPGDSGVLVVTRVRSTNTRAHESAGATGTRHSTRPLMGETTMHNSGASRGEIAKACLELEQTPSFRGDAKHRTRNLEIPRCAIAHLRSGPADHPGMTAKKPSRRDRQDRLWLRLLAMATQFSRDFGVQHLFQPGQGLGDQGGVGNAVIPADHDIDGLVLHHAITEDKRPRAQRMQLAGAIGGDRGHPKTAEPVGTLASEIEA